MRDPGNEVATTSVKNVSVWKQKRRICNLILELKGLSRVAPSVARTVINRDPET